MVGERIPQLGRAGRGMLKLSLSCHTCWETSTSQADWGCKVKTDPWGKGTWPLWGSVWASPAHRTRTVTHTAFVTYLSCTANMLPKDAALSPTSNTKNSLMLFSKRTWFPWILVSLAEWITHSFNKLNKTEVPVVFLHLANCLFWKVLFLPPN